MKKLPLIITFVVIAFTFFLYFKGNPFIEHGINRDYALLLCLSAIFPAVHYLWRLSGSKAGVPPIPFMPVIGLIYGLYYGFPALYYDELKVREIYLSNEDINQAVRLAFFGWLSLMAGFYLFSERLIPMKPLQIYWNPHKAARFGLLLIAAGLLMRLIRGIINIPASAVQIANFIEMLFEAGTGMLLVLYLQGFLRGAGKWLLLAVFIPLYFIISLSTGLVSTFIVSCFFIFSLIWACRRKLPWMIITCLIVASTLMRGSIMEFRNRAWYQGEFRDSGTLQKANLLFNIVWDRINSEGLKNAIAESSEVTTERLSQLSTFSYVISLTPSSIPYWKGTTYKALPSSFIPRILWPNKPEKTLGQTFGHAYDFLDAQDTWTSINLAQIVEFYINFGPTGVILGMFFLGFLYALIYKKINRPKAGEGTLIIAALIFKNLINIESDFSLVFGNVIQLIALLYLILSVVKERAPSRLKAESINRIFTPSDEGVPPPAQSG